MDAQGTARALIAVFEELRPHLPDGAGIKLSPRTKWTIVQRADAGSVDVEGLVIQADRRDDQYGPPAAHGSGLSVRGLGPWVPFLPRSLRRRLAAQNALETLLGLFYDPDQGDGFHRSINYKVTTTVAGDEMTLSYTMPGTCTPITLGPLPGKLFQ